MFCPCPHLPSAGKVSAPWRASSSRGRYIDTVVQSHTDPWVSVHDPCTPTTLCLLSCVLITLGITLVGPLPPISQRTCVEGWAWPMELRLTKLKGTLLGLTLFKGTELSVNVTVCLSVRSCEHTHGPWCLWLGPKGQCCPVPHSRGKKTALAGDTFQGFVWLFLKRDIRHKIHRQISGPWI
jgi:hypothetical protein